MSSFCDEVMLSTSPASIRGIPRRENISPTSDDGLARPRQSPVIIHSYDPNDPEVRERQRTMDVDMAMQLSRVRRASVSQAAGTSPYEPVMPTLSPDERHHFNAARGEELREGAENDNRYSSDSRTMRRRSSLLDLRSHINQAHDPSLLASLGFPHTEHEDPSTSLFGLPTYQANVSRFNIDFTLMEDFAADEKARLGIDSPPQTFTAKPFQLNSTTAPDTARLSPVEETTDLPPTVPRSSRHRKLSQNNLAPRMHRKGLGGKMALFEKNLGESSQMSRFGDHTPHASVNVGPGLESRPPSNGGALPGMGILNTGHDRPYRFSFYSNALSSSIHARSLSELPADGQSFRDLFLGLLIPSDVPSDPQPHASDDPALTSPIHVNSHPNASGTLKRTHKPNIAPPAMEANFNGRKRDNVNGNSVASTTGTKSAPSNDQPNGAVGGSGDMEGTTWWLDVQSPTDDEMKMLSEVFSIHPLTTEDILMEEIREKIELFRNYYFVCFRSFDQDPYSPTHLEPLNMYIIVFREGILSFHFHPTPHPQNVRRRIKQLKDYISVTSDWISYALIDDITDAFGPLIQSIEYEVESIDELVLILRETEQSDMLRRIGTCRKKVMGLLRLMGNKADVVKGLAKRCNENWRIAPTSDIGLYLSDIQDHLITMTQNLNHYEKILSRSHSNYLAQISIEMTDANNKINDVLSKLTALGTVLIPMNLVTGLWGMNVHVPGENIEGFAWFASIIACLAAFAVVGTYSAYKIVVRKS